MPGPTLVGPFTTARGRAADITDAMLRGPRFRRLFHGVHVDADQPLDLVIWLRAAQLVLPADAVVSHVTALHLYGLDIGPPWPLHLSTRATTHTRQKNLRVHQRLARITAHVHSSGLPVTGPDRTIVDIATKVTFVELVQVAEWFIHRGMTTIEVLGDYAMNRHLDGVRRTRRALGLMREGAESPMESLTRLMIVFARLPEPRCNVDIHDDHGAFVARGDLVYPAFKVLVEYDGWHHERDAAQRQHDHLRRERLEALGWRVVVITAEDMKDKKAIVRRVHAALVDRGYAGRPPLFNTMWSTWFGESRRMSAPIDLDAAR